MNFRQFSWLPAFSLFLFTGCSAILGVPDVTILKTHYPVVIYQGPKKPAQIKIQKARPTSWAGVDQISKAAVGAIIVSEDWAFYQHNGYDPNQIREALKEDMEQKRFARGASTITQQVAKNVFLEQDKRLTRKLKELILAVRMEFTLKKPKILEIYLNIAEWGEGIFGIGPAAQYYFKKAPSELTAKEGAFLAMLLPSPKRYGQSFRAKHLTTYARHTIASILDKMVRAHYLTDEEHDQELAKALPFEVDGPGPDEEPPLDLDLES